MPKPQALFVASAFAVAVLFADNQAFAHTITDGDGPYQPNVYFSRAMDCPSDSYIEFVVDELDVECPYDILRITTGPTADVIFNSNFWCNHFDAIVHQQINTTVNQATLHFSSDQSVQHQGFVVNWWCASAATGERIPEETSHDTPKSSAAAAIIIVLLLVLAPLCCVCCCICCCVAHHQTRKRQQEQQGQIRDLEIAFQNNSYSQLHDDHIHDQDTPLKSANLLADRLIAQQQRLKEEELLASQNRTPFENMLFNLRKEGSEFDRLDQSGKALKNLHDKNNNPAKLTLPQAVEFVGLFTMTSTKTDALRMLEPQLVEGVALRDVVMASFEEGFSRELVLDSL